MGEGEGMCWERSGVYGAWRNLEQMERSLDRIGMAWDYGDVVMKVYWNKNSAIPCG